MEEIFTAFAKFGNAKSDGKTITLSNADKWMKQAGVIDGKKITTTDTGICFTKFKKKTLTCKEFLAYVEELAKQKKMGADELKGKLMKCKQPGTTATTAADKADVVSRMTDTLKYTGTQKERFDADGKGKGIAGREDDADTSGYVAAFKGKDTYDKTH